jgi:putative thioredoxin
VLEFVGLLPEPQLRDFLDRLAPSESDHLVRRAADLEKGDPKEAEALYRRALDADRNHDAARVGLARVLIDRGGEDEAVELLEYIGAAGEHGTEAERLNGVLALRRLARDCGDEASLRQRLQKEPENAQVRYELGCVAAAAGRYPEALDLLLSAAECDRKLAAAKVREAMVQVFHVLGVRSPLADEYRDKLTKVLY